MSVSPIGSNQTEVGLPDRRFLFSYSTPVAGYVDGLGYVRTNRFFSATTSRHINRWLDGSTATVIDHAELVRLSNGGEVNLEEGPGEVL
jgi:hypothetical protein